MNRLSHSILVSGGAIALLASGVLHAQDSAVLIGGAGSFGSNGSSDPATLDDFITVATARYTFHLDVPNSKLVLTVDNTSPVLVGIPNPVLTDVFFNVPSAITGLSIGSQTGSGHATPTWTLAFDADLATSPNPNGADGFGAFSVHLATPSGVQNAISNPAADTLGVPPGSDVIGPATFTLDLVGDLTGLTAFSFTSLLSVFPPGHNPQVAVGKFQSGGDAASSGFVSPGSGCSFAAASESLGGGCGGATLSLTPGYMGQVSTVTIANAAPSIPVKIFASSAGASPVVWKGCTIFLRLSQLTTITTVVTDLTGSASAPVLPPTYAASPACCGYQYVVQAVMLDLSAPVGARVRFTNAAKGTLGS